MNILITGVAGFIGFHVAKAFCADNHNVIGIDSLNDYYDVSLKKARIKYLNNCNIDVKKFRFKKNDLLDLDYLTNLIQENDVDVIIHLAAQAGVRYSIKNPMTYVKNNLEAFTNVLEAARHTNIKNLIYASTSSVYGANTSQPFKESQSIAHPVQFYAATKKANELMAHSYSHLFNLPTIGLRFFTVYGPWGRPDMALFKFTQNILNDQPIDLYNGGNHTRDFTYVEDVAECIVRLASKPPKKMNIFDSNDPNPAISSAPYRIFNVGNSTPVGLIEYVRQIENCLGKKARINLLPLQQGDVPETCSDTHALKSYIDFAPKIRIEEGIRQFIDWYLNYYNIGDRNG